MDNTQTLTREEVKAKIAEIHNAFDTASENALHEAKAIIEKDATRIIEKGNRLSALGFGATKEAKMAANHKNEVAKAKEQVSFIEKYRVDYPFNKFITEKQVEEICKKHGLLKGDSSMYTGFIPEKNLKQIEDFKLEKEDLDDTYIKWGIDSINSFNDLINMLATDSRVLTSSTDRRFGKSFLTRSSPKKEEVVKESKIQFQICAPAKDFNTNHATLTNGYILIPDPIVLAKVKGGYLIVTAWGDEASDENVVNEQMN